jgi:nucleoside-diphosphate-sugar epimerase
VLVVFGASSDIGRRLTARLAAAGDPVRGVSRRLPGTVHADLDTGEGVAAALDGATTVVSCAHARFTAQLLAALPARVDRLVLMGSAWRYSRVPNPRADAVRRGEAAFLASRRDGVMLHATMIYGGAQENNIQRLLAQLRRLPVVPAPGGGRQTVQPIYIDDVVACLFAAARRDWRGGHVIPIAGPPLTWRRMVEICAAAIGRHPPILPVPAAPLIGALALANRFGIGILDANVIRRFREDVDIPLAEMTAALGVTPRDFESGLRLAVENWTKAKII